MKNLLAISKKGIIFICAAIMITAGVLIAVLPNSSDGHGMDGMDSAYTKYVTIPILNNTGQRLTISRLDIKVPGECYEGKMDKMYNETRVSEIRFSDDNVFGDADDTVVYTSTSGNCCCSRAGCGPQPYNITNYSFSDAKAWCRVKLNSDIASTDGAYTVTYSYRFPDDDVDDPLTLRSNELTFILS